jgi:hypothetical protein
MHHACIGGKGLTCTEQLHGSMLLKKVGAAVRAVVRPQES